MAKRLKRPPKPRNLEFEKGGDDTRDALIALDFSKPVHRDDEERDGFPRRRDGDPAELRFDE